MAGRVRGAPPASRSGCTLMGALPTPAATQVCLRGQAGDLGSTGLTVREGLYFKVDMSLNEVREGPAPV